MQINYNCELPREKFAVLFLICSWSGLTLFKWQESANPNSTTSFLIQFSFNGLIESPVLKCVKTSPKFAFNSAWKDSHKLKVHFEKIHFGKIHFGKINFGGTLWENTLWENTLWENTLTTADKILNSTVRLR